MRVAKKIQNTFIIWISAEPYIIYNREMSERKMWQQKEDNMIRKIVKQNQNRSENQKWKWSEIAQILQKRIPGCTRSGKQCRQRWFNHLDPNIIKDRQLNKHEIDKLFLLQSKLGNKWANIAKQFPGRTDNNLKNFFYSSLRRAIRQINYFVSHYKKKSNIKSFKQTLLAKILNISDQKYRQKLDIKSQKADELASNVKDMLSKLSLEEEEKQLTQEDINFREKIVRSIQQFNKSCKKRKSKRAESDEQPDLQNFPQYLQNNRYAESSQQLAKIPRKKTGQGKKINGKQQKEKVIAQNKSRIKRKPKQENDNKQPPIKELFKKPSQDVQPNKKSLRKKKSEIQLLYEGATINIKQPSFANKKLSSRIGSGDGFKYQSLDLFRKNSAQHQSLRMITRQSSFEDNRFTDFLHNLQSWKKNESRAQGGLFQNYFTHEINPMLLESLNISETLPKFNEGSVNQSGFLKIFKGDSKIEH